MGPDALEDLITAFSRLPGIGRKTAQRLAFHVLKQDRSEAETLASAIIGARDRIAHCSRCHNFTEAGTDLCEVCRDSRRDRQLVCVVAEASDVLILEVNQLIDGVYHVLGGVLSPLNGVMPEDLGIEELVQRVKTDSVREVILALDASVEGDTTADYIGMELTPLTKVTRPARGLPVGADLALADRVTLAHALEGRYSL